MTNKDAGMRICLERELRDAFVAACHSQGPVAAGLLRDFMRSFASQRTHEQAALFEPGAKPERSALQRGAA